MEIQPLAANVSRLLEALKYLGAPLDDDAAQAIGRAVADRDAHELQRIMDAHVLFVVSIDRQSRVKVESGAADSRLQQAGFVPVLVRIVNHAGITRSLRIDSPQAGPVYAGVAELSMKRQQQEHLRANENTAGGKDRFLELEMFQSPPMKDRLSGLAVEYAIALFYSSEAGKREATIVFELTDEKPAASRGEVRVAFDIQPAVAVRLTVKDTNGEPTVARLLFRDAARRVYPPQPKRLAPDLFFQPHIYRGDGETVLLPPGKFSVESSRGPEYRVLEREVTIVPSEAASLKVDLSRWVNPMEFGFYSGDHHIHAAGCAHYNSPTEGVLPEHMFRQVKGEGLNVGCVLTWGPCFDYQRRFFTPDPHQLSDARTVLKYDLEISGFGSQALGHVCLLNLQDQLYPGSDGTTKGWPTWTTPVMRWAKEQGGITGYAHSASGLAIDPAAAAKRLLARIDANKSGDASANETEGVLLPESFEKIDADRDGSLTERELRQSHNRVADQLPNLAIPEMNGVGAMEIAVSVSEGVCDFISAMDTPRIQEWNTWYHLLNCGFPLKVSGETDFPCMASRSVGQGRVYVRLGKIDRVDFAAWCAGLAAGRSYVSDGYAHALEFAVDGRSPGNEDIKLEKAGEVSVRAKVAFAAETPLAVAYGGIVPPAGRRVVGDTVLLHGPRTEQVLRGGRRLVEIVVNGRAVASREVLADGQIHDLDFTIPIDRSSWVGLRHFPQLHTNPVNVLVADQPIRASRDSALWCIETINLLWRNRQNRIAPPERDEARKTFDRALDRYRRIAREAVDRQ
ncbi:MAG: CehA/McbA family metallohydrolase [Pirellulales bacterium]